ncbi:complex I intermediate-associated protein 30-domain-containing protein [Pavlovales sp. CCMP2436]|nr:complex I intermediate-associated protein 30-domain-containing protein [Pavlovales sp. CCMP2436]
MVLHRLLAAYRALVPPPWTTPPTRMSLFSFASSRAMDKWFVYSDVHDGGLSTVEWRHEERNGGVGVFQGRIETGFDESLGKDDRATQESFSGATMVRSGYASLRSLEPAPFGALDDFDGLAVVFRSDCRPYVLNVKTDRYMQDTQEVFQSLIPPSPPLFGRSGHERPRPLEPFELGPWREVRVPWASFKLTWRGFVQPHIVQLDPRRIDSIGIALYAADHGHVDIGYAAMHDGPFVFEMQAVDAYGSGENSNRAQEGTHQSLLRVAPGPEATDPEQ